MAESRRTVTVLFCDVVDWTALGGAVDAEVLRAQQTRFHGEARAALERHGGTVEKFIGDAVMAVFGWPVAHEDDALRAVRAAAELQDRLDGLALRIGINTGEVAAGDADALVTGDAVNVAKRLEQAAEAGDVLLGEATRGLVSAAIELEPLSPLRVKGVREPVTAWRLVDLLGDARPYARRLDAPFVGRVDELARLRKELERARDGCRLVTVIGAPGIGKSRLAFEFGEELRDRATVLTGRCLPYGEGITFWPLAEALREAGGDPELVTEAGEQLFWRARRFFEELAAERPLVLVFEDIHWAEPTFLDLLEYLVGWSRVTPILILCLARPELLERRPDWPRDGALALEPLSKEEAETLVAGLGERVDGETRRRIGEIAEGNPLFVEQLTAAAGEGEPTVPPTLQALLASRLDRLGAEERAVVERAAVIGRDFTAADVAALSGDEPVRSLLLGLVRKELLRPAGGEEGFAFRHILIRDAAYDGIPKRLRAELHERCAELVEDEVAGYHLEQAHRYRAELGETEPALAERAAALLGVAGRRAFSRSDVPAAVNLLRRALALVSATHPERPELMRELSTAYWAAGDFEQADSVLRDALAAAQELADRRLEWYVRLEAAAQQSQTASMPGVELAVVAEQAVRVFEELRDDAGLARALRRVALVERGRCRYAATKDVAERARRHARRAGDRQEEARIVDLICMALLYGPDPAPAAAERCRRLLRETSGNLALEANVLSALAGLEALLGDFEEARKLCDQADATFEELGLRLHRVGLSQVVAEIELLAGDPVAAERVLRPGLELLTEAGGGGLIGNSAVLLGHALYVQGRIGEADELADLAARSAAEDDIPAQVAWRRVRARIEQDPALAREATVIAERTDGLVLRADALLALAEITAAAGERAEAHAAAAAAADLYERKGSMLGAARACALVSPSARR